MNRTDNRKNYAGLPYIPEFRLILTEYELKSEKTTRIILEENSDGSLTLKSDDGKKLDQFTEQDKNYIYEQLGKIDISEPPADTNETEGKGYSITVCAGLNKLTFQWRNETIDKNWQPLINIRDKYMNLPE
ncbi:MAG TPA: hypothetical protein PLK90_02700 [Clostridiales bacterium]|nr:hypothetical protein [Clostridiales bacterium]HQP69287.1 hypothetical protein [Clostridiales bacterium]